MKCDDCEHVISPWRKDEKTQEGVRIRVFTRWGLYKFANPVDPYSLKPPGFNP